jgi:NAD-dependent SIR2 family protein deacetylase
MFKSDRIGECMQCGQRTKWKTDDEPDCPGAPLCSKCGGVEIEPESNPAEAPVGPTSGTEVPEPVLAGVFDGPAEPPVVIVGDEGDAADYVNERNAPEAMSGGGFECGITEDDCQEFDYPIAESEVQP